MLNLQLARGVTSPIKGKLDEPPSHNMHYNFSNHHI